MSQSAHVFELARTTYGRLIPLLRPTVSLLLTTTLGAGLFGPIGVFPGAGLGAALNHPATTDLINAAIAGLRTALLFVLDNPVVFTLITALIGHLNRYLNLRRDELEEQPHAN